MTTKLSHALVRLSSKWSDPVLFGSRSAFIDTFVCLLLVVLAFSLVPRLQAQQITKSLGLQTNSEAQPEKQAKKKVKKQSRRKSPYLRLINGSFSHVQEPLAEDGLPLWIYGDARMMRGRKEFPMIIVLHGRRDNVKPGTEFKPQAIAIPWAQSLNQRRDPCFVVQPYYPPRSGWEKIPEKLDATVAHLLENLPVNPNRVYLMGFSNGAQGTFQALARNPDQYAAAITVAGPVGIKSVVGQIKTPIRAWVGENDNSLKKNVRCIALAKALKESGVDIELVVVKNAGHACHGVPTRDPEIHNWLFSQQRQENADD